VQKKKDPLVTSSQWGAGGDPYPPPITGPGETPQLRGGGGGGQEEFKKRKSLKVRKERELSVRGEEGQGIWKMWAILSTTDF